MKAAPMNEDEATMISRLPEDTAETSVDVVDEVSRVSPLSSPSSPVLQQLYCLDKSSPDFEDKLIKIFYGGEYREWGWSLQPGNDLAWLIDYLDEAFDCLDPSSYASQECLRELRRICSNWMILPKSCTISSNLLEIHPNPFAAGGFGDAFHGAMGSSKVCIKRTQIFNPDELRKVTGIFCKEVVILASLTHENIVPLLGVTINPPQLISNWMAGGQLPGYIKKHPSADILRLFSDVAAGLEYLHSRNVVHGDLKGQNVLVDDSGHARVADFGLTAVLRNMDSTQVISQNGCFSRWTAPEVLKGGWPTKETDVFSFAMLMVEVFTGAVPFADRSALLAMLALTRGERPPRPTHPTLTADLWASMQQCWNDDPCLRPKISEVLKVPH